MKYDPKLRVEESSADYLVNTVNTVGVMGKGVALAMREKFPEIMSSYKTACDNGRLQPGLLHIAKVEDGARTVVNLASKKHYRDPSQYEWAGAGMFYLNHYLRRLGVEGKSLALPLPGAGNGGLDPARIQQMARIYLADAVSEGLDVTLCHEELEPIADPIFYAGIGSRATPDATLELMQEVASGLEAQGVNLRSGGALGADTAFYKGATSAGAQGSEIFLPYPKKAVPNGIVLESAVFDRLAQNFHPNPASITPDPNRRNDKRASILKLMSRNGNQLFGRDFTNPTNLVVCHTPEGSGKGGTGQALRLAQAAGIPAIDLGHPSMKGVTAEEVVERGIEAIGLYRARRGLPELEARQIPQPAP